MGVCDSSIKQEKPNTITPSPNHYDSFELSKIIPNSYNNNIYSKNLKEVLSENMDKSNYKKLNIVNSNRNNARKNSQSKTNFQNNKINKFSQNWEINISKTVDKKQINKNIDNKNQNDINKTEINITENSQKSYLDKRKHLFRNESKKIIKSNEKVKSIVINNINIHNKSIKDVQPFYFNPKSIFSKESNNRTHRNNTSNMHAKQKIYKNKRLKNLEMANSKDKILTKNNSNKNINILTRTEIHRTFNNILSTSSTDKLNIINNFVTNKKINYKLDYIIDVHNIDNKDNNYINNTLYLIDDISNNYKNKKENIYYSTEKDYNDIIRNDKDNIDINKIYIELLKLKERKWQDDLINISKIISTLRTQKKNNQEININDALNKILTLYDHFNWIINSIAFCFSSIIYENKNETINQYNINSLHFPNYDSLFWFKGFKWKGLYIRIDKDINCINNIKKEIKALNYFFLDYLHIIWNKDIHDDLELINKNNILSNNIVFPLIGYCQINSFILIVSSIIKPENTYNNLEDLVEISDDKIELFSKMNMVKNYISGDKNKNTSRYHRHNNFKDKNINNDFRFLNDFKKKQFLINKLNHSIDYPTDIRSESANKNKLSESRNNKKDEVDNTQINKCDIFFFKDDYYIEDLLMSKLFSSINKNNLIKIKNGKYILLNVAKFVPNLFENKFKNSIKKINFFGNVGGQKKYFTLNYNSSLSINLKNISETKKLFKDVEIFDKLTPKIILEKIYNMIPSSKFDIKNVIIGNIIFRILFYNTSENRKNSKKNFVDFLFNYQKDSKKNNISHNVDKKNKNEDDFIYVQEPYVIIYDLIEPIKLDYSLIKSIKTKDNKNELINDIFFLRTNYIDYFMTWCKLFNRNSFNIKRYGDLKYYMKKFGINQNLLFFALVKINNEEISDVIKIHLLVKSFKFICFNKDNGTVLDKIGKNLKSKDLNLYENLKDKIYFYIMSILYPNEILPSNQKLFKYIYEQLLFSSNILFFKYKLIDDYLSLGLLNSDKLFLFQNKKFYSFFNIQTPQKFLQHCILIARKKPFLFLTELEYKLNFIIDPYIKFKASLSIESMSHQLHISHIDLNNIIVKTFVDPNEISGLILTKIIKKYEEKFIDKSRNINIKDADFNLFTKNDYKLNDFDSTDDDPKINNIIYLSNLNMKPGIANHKVNIRNNNKSIKINQNEKNIFEEINNDKEFGGKNDDFIDTKNFNKVNNFLNKNNSNITGNYYDNNDIISKLSSDKTMDEIEFAKQKINIDKNKNNFKNNNLLKIDKINFKEINENIIFFIPQNCHKIMFNFEKNNIQNDSKNLYPNLGQYYSIKNIQIIKDWVVTNDIIYKGIVNSHNFDCEKVLIKSYILLFLYFFYIEKNRKEFLHLNSKILSLFKNNFHYNLSLKELSIINLIQALSNNNYIQNEEYFSKCVMLLLMNYGDPRGRYNDSHGILQFPLWEIARKTYKLEEAIINENFKEMYQALDFFEKNKGLYNISIKKNFDIYNFNFKNNIQMNLEKIKIMNIKGLNNLIKKVNKINNDNFDNLNETESINFMINNIDENPSEININKDLTDLDISLNQSFFDKKNVEKMCISRYIFPSISSKITNVGRVFYRKEFIIYIIKEIMSLYLSKGILYNKKYLENTISDELIVLKNIKDIKTSINQENTSKQLNKSNYIKTPIKRKNSNNEFVDTKVNNSSFRINPYLKFEKQYNNKNILNSQNNKNYSYQKNSKSYNNGIIKSRIMNNLSKTNKNSFIAKNSSSKEKKIINKNTNIKNNIKTNNKIFSHFLYIELFQKLSFKKNLPNGIIISCGNNKHNETSHDRYDKLTLPRVIFKLKNEMIDKIYSGWEHNMVLNNKGEIFSFGHNHLYQCGLPNTTENSSNNENINDPTNISILNNNLKAIKISCGNEHSLIISKDKNVYGVGSNEAGLLGLSDIKLKTYKPIKINFFNKIGTKKIENYNGKMVDISCGTMHNLALTEDGKVFSWGSMQGGQLGLPSEFIINKNKKLDTNKKFFISTPFPIPFFLDNNIKISQIKCGEAHSLALTNKGKVYSWGFGSNGQLGLGFCEDIFEPGEGMVKSRIFEPQLIHTFKEYNLHNSNKSINYSYNNFQIKEINCGKTFSAFINTNNSLLLCGINDLYQLGLKDKEKKEKIFNHEIQCDDYIYPSLLRAFNNKKVEKISCGESHTLAIVLDLNSNTQSIWSWGNNNFGQIGHGLMVKNSLPKEIEYLKEYNMSNFSDVSCGGFHSLILLKRKNNLDWIEKDYEEIILGVIKEIGEL